MDNEVFSKRIWEYACGEGHIAKVLEQHGYDVTGTDLIDRGYSKLKPLDFLQFERKWLDVDIITNPPYKYAQKLVEKALEVVSDGHKVAMFLKLTFLEGKNRKRMFAEYPPRMVYVSSSRLKCAMNGDFSGDSKNSAISFC